ncbi:MAG: hypothetical protein HN849_21850 [Victivallales bacterium]|nr:hypothetical protein [Victivallales bacterium]
MDRHGRWTGTACRGLGLARRARQELAQIAGTDHGTPADWHHWLGTEPTWDAVPYLPYAPPTRQAPSCAPRVASTQRGAGQMVGKPTGGLTGNWIRAMLWKHLYGYPGATNANHATRHYLSVRHHRSRG